MSKYTPLSQRLQRHRGDAWRASFAEIEEVLGFPLPKGARTGKAWWANEGDKPHAKAWTEKGWQAHDVDHDKGAVTFRRSAVSPAAAPPAVVEPAAPEPARKRPAVGLAVAIAGSVAILAGVGVVALRAFTRRR